MTPSAWSEVSRYLMPVPQPLFSQHSCPIYSCPFPGCHQTILVVFCSDDTPHVADERLGEEAVLAIVERLTKLIREVFPGEKASAISVPWHSLNPGSGDNSSKM